MVAMRLRFVLIFLALGAVSIAPAVVEKWNQPFPPHRVIGNVYYVGTNFLASFLITTPQGDILINTSYAESVPLIRANVEKLGFHFQDIKIILLSHAHDDHCAGTALAKRLTGAKLMVMDGDVKEVEDGGASDFQYRNQHWAPVKVDRILHDGDQVKLGETVLTAVKTAGHTKGCTTWTMLAAEGGKKYHVVITGSPNVNPGYRLVGNAMYPQIAADYAHTFEVLKSLPCDVPLGAHGNYYGMDEKYAKLRAGGANPFIDPQGYQAMVADRAQTYRDELKKQESEEKR